MTRTKFTIRKKNGKLRHIVAPSVKLKAYQRKLLKTKFEPLLNDLLAKSGLYEIFHGFRHRKNSVTAASYHIGYKATVMFDLANFFDTVTSEHIKRGGYTLTESEIQYCLHDDYCAQGFPTSPTLCNIALIPFIKTIRSGLSAEFEDFALTIYADDIQVSINRTDKDSWHKVRTIVTEAAETHKFAINPNKTRVRFAKYGARRILGVNVTDTGITATRKTNRKVRAVAHRVKFDKSKKQVLGGLRTWQLCKPPRGISYML